MSEVPFGIAGEVKTAQELQEAIDTNDKKKIEIIVAKAIIKSAIASMDGGASSEIVDKVVDEVADKIVEESENTEESYSDRVEKQEKEIGDVESGEKDIDRLNTHETGNYGEMKMDQDLRSKGYERISNKMVTDIDGKTHQGLDGVYYNPEGKPQYIIADAKYGTSQLGETKDGKQMSDSWIDARLDKDVGPDKADEIRMEKIMNPDNVGSYVAHVDAEGNISYDRLDGNANVIEKDVKINE